MKDNNLLLNSDIDSEFLILISKENQSFKVEGKKRVLKTILVLNLLSNLELSLSLFYTQNVIFLYNILYVYMYHVYLFSAILRVVH